MKRVTQDPEFESVETLWRLAPFNVTSQNHWSEGLGVQSESKSSSSDGQN